MIVLGDDFLGCSYISGTAKEWPNIFYTGEGS
jgi:hypothetical protein